MYQSEDLHNPYYQARIFELVQMHINIQLPPLKETKQWSTGVGLLITQMDFNILSFWPNGNKVDNDPSAGSENFEEKHLFIRIINYKVFITTVVYIRMGWQQEVKVRFCKIHRQYIFLFVLLIALLYSFKQSLDHNLSTSIVYENVMADQYINEYLIKASHISTQVRKSQTRLTPISLCNLWVCYSHNICQILFKSFTMWQVKSQKPKRLYSLPHILTVFDSFNL